jgi:hypothetical protein
LAIIVLDRKSDTSTFPELRGYLNPQESADSNGCIDSDPPDLVQPVGKLGTISIVNSRILNMTIPATTTCNSNILDALNSKMNGNR